MSDKTKWLDSSVVPPPKDGSPVLLYIGDWTKPWSLHSVPQVGVFQEYHPNAKGHCCWRTVNGNKIGAKADWEPKYWMPLPAPVKK